MLLEKPALQSGIQHLAAGTMDHPGLNASRFMTIVSILRGLAGPASPLKTIETGRESASKPIWVGADVRRNNNTNTTVAAID